MKDLQYYLNLPYKIEIKKIPDKEGGGWVLAAKKYIKEL